MRLCWIIATKDDDFLLHPGDEDDADDLDDAADDDDDAAAGADDDDDDLSEVCMPVLTAWVNGPRCASTTGASNAPIAPTSVHIDVTDDKIR